MPKKNPNDFKRWEEAMALIAEKFDGGVTVDDLYLKLFPGKVEDDADTLRRRTATSQMLRRLRQYGYLRPGEPQYQEGRGRPASLYHMTEKAKKRFA